MIDTTKILPGQEFKNMQKLSVALTGQKMPAGNRYVVRVNEMKKYLSWDKIPGSNRIIITDVHAKQENKYIPRGRYNSQILSNMKYLELNKKYTIYDLYELLGMTSERFTKPKYFLDSVNNTKLSLSTYRYFYKKLNATLTQMLYINLNIFAEKGCISYYRDYSYEFEKGYKPVDIPKGYMESVKQEALAQFSYDNEWSVIHSSKSQEYKDYILKKLSPYHVKHFNRCFVFTDIKEFIQLPEANKTAMNKLILEKLTNYSHHFEPCNQKKIQSIIFSTVPLQ